MPLDARRLGRFASVWLLAFVPGWAQAEPVSVTFRGGRVDVRATAAPLSEVLQQLARVTGMKVVYDGSLPPAILSLSLEDRTPVEAVMGVLEGLGVNYALAADAAGTRVETLILSGAMTAASAMESTPDAPRVAAAQARPAALSAYAPDTDPDEVADIVARATDESVAPPPAPVEEPRATPVSSPAAPHQVHTRTYQPSTFTIPQNVFSGVTPQSPAH